MRTPDIRPLTPAAGSVCDWGHCDRPATCERSQRDDGEAYVACCDRCAKLANVLPCGCCGGSGRRLRGSGIGNVECEQCDGTGIHGGVQLRHLGRREFELSVPPGVLVWLGRWVGPDGFGTSQRSYLVNGEQGAVFVQKREDGAGHWWGRWPDSSDVVKCRDIEGARREAERHILELQTGGKSA